MSAAHVSIATVTGGARARRPFIGRTRELDHLLQRDQALSRRVSSVVAVQGGAGMGKTRLVDEFVDLRESSAPVLRVRGQQHDPPPYLPFLSLLRQAARISSDPATKAAARSAIGLLTGEETPSTHEWRRRDDGAFRASLFLTVAETLEAMLAQGQAVIVCEDVQWLDAPSAALLEFIVDDVLANTSGPGVFVILTSRGIEPGEQGFSFDSLADQQHSTRIRLQPLDDRERSELVLALGLHTPPARLLRELLRASAGNPLFLTEAAAQYLEHGVDSDGELSSWFRRPDDLGTLVDLGLANYSEEQLEVLAAAAALGTSFTAAQLEAAVGLDADEVAGVLRDALSSQALAHEAGSYRFVHDLWQDRLYNQIAPEARLKIHDRIARSLCVVGYPADSAAVLELSHHLRRGSRIDRDLVHRCCEHAGDLASRSVAWTDAAENYSVALDASSPGDDGRLSLKLKAANAFERELDISVASELYQSLALEARAVGDVHYWSAGLEGEMRLSTAYQEKALAGSLEAAGLIEFLDQVSDDGARAPILTAWANLEATAGRTDQARELAKQAVEAAKSSGQDASRAYFAAGYAELIPLQIDAAIDNFRRCDRLNVEAEDEWTRSESLTRLAWAQLIAGDLDGASAASAEAARIAIGTLHWSDASLAEIVHGAVLAARGDFDGALEQAELAQRHAARSRYQAAPAVAYPLLVTVHRLRGDHQAVAETLQRWSSEAARGHGTYRALADQDLHRPLVGSEPRCSAQTNLGTLPRIAALVELAGARGESEQLGELRDRLAECDQATFASTGQLVARLRAIVSRLQDDPTSAIAQLRTGISIAESVGALTELALCHLEMARVGADAEARHEHSALGADLALRVGLAPYFYSHIGEVANSTEVLSRDQLTIVFSDLASSTQLSVDHGDEAYLQAIDRSRSILRARCLGTGGTEFGTQGDGFLAHFSDPAAAIDFALATLGDLDRVEVEGPVVQLKIGIATGRPILRDDSVYGQTVNLAARLSDRANPNEIVADGTTRYLAERTHRFETSGAARFKGFPDLMPTHLVLASRPNQ